MKRKHKKPKPQNVVNDTSPDAHGSQQETNSTTEDNIGGGKKTQNPKPPCTEKKKFSEESAGVRFTVYSNFTLAFLTFIMVITTSVLTCHSSKQVYLAQSVIDSTSKYVAIQREDERKRFMMQNRPFMVFRHFNLVVYKEHAPITIVGDIENIGVTNAFDVEFDCGMRLNENDCD